MLPSYHPYQVARHLASEISADAALRVVALPHTEGLLYYLLDSLGFTRLNRLTRPNKPNRHIRPTKLTILTMLTMPHTEGCGVSDERLAARTLLGHLASPLVRHASLLKHGFILTMALFSYHCYTYYGHGQACLAARARLYLIWLYLPWLNLLWPGTPCCWSMGASEHTTITLPMLWRSEAPTRAGTAGPMSP